MRLPLPPVRQLLLMDMNRVVKYLIISDVILLGAAELFNPIFALFVVEFIDGGNAAVVGTAFAIYYMTKSVGQIFSAEIVDNIKGERDDFYFLVGGSALFALLPLFYLFIHSPIQLYALMFALGIATAMAYPPYMAIFTRHIDHGKVGMEWGMKFTLADLIGAASASVGGVIALTLGFHVLILIYVIICVSGTLALIPAWKSMRKARKTKKPKRSSRKR